MKIGAQLLVQEYPEFLETAKALEKNDYAYAWVVDSQMLWEDAYVYVALAMQETNNLIFGSAVSNPVTKHYTVPTSAAATLAGLYPGRWILGMGRGDSAVRTLGMKPVKTADMEIILRKMQDLLHGNTVDEAGSEIRLRFTDQDLKVPLCYAATGPRNLKIGGAIADIVMLQVGTHPASVKWAVDNVKQGAEQAGRDPSEVEVSLLCGMWVSDDLKEARDNTRWAATCATNHLEDVVRAGPNHGMPKELLSMVEVKRDQYDYYGGHLDSNAEHTEYLTDDMIDRFAIAGSASHCIERIQELEALGVHEISSAYLNGHFDQIDLVGEQIISKI